jgi:hypothetical protein
VQPDAKDRLTKPELLGIIAHPLFVEWLQFEHWVPELGTTMLEAYSREAAGLDDAIRQLLHQMASTQEYGLWRVGAIAPGGIELCNAKSSRQFQVYSPSRSRELHVDDQIYARLARQGEHWEIVSMDDPLVELPGSADIRTVRRRKGPVTIKNSRGYFLLIQQYVEASRQRKTPGFTPNL